MTVLITSDLHLDSNAQNADRWNLFPWLKRQIQKYEVSQVLILGDVSDSKDRHEAKFVNRVVTSMIELSDRTEVIWLLGNHDFIDPNHPFFGFLNKASYMVRVITEPTTLSVEGSPSLFLPCTRNWEKSYGEYNFKPFKYIFTHQTFDGALAENGIDLRGISPSIFSGTKAKVYSGDIHVPQTINKQIEYIGSPYHVRFGDTFKPKVLLLEGNKTTDLHFPFRGREVLDIRTVEDLSKTEFILGTQVKIKVHLKRSEFPEWPAIRKEVKAIVNRKGWELCGLSLKKMKSKDRTIENEDIIKAEGSPVDILESYAKKKKLNKRMIETGKMFITEVSK